MRLRLSPPHPAMGSGYIGALSHNHATRRLLAMWGRRRGRSPLERWQTHLDQSLHIVPGQLGATPVLERNLRSVLYFLSRRSSMLSSTLSPGAWNTGFWDRSVPSEWTRSRYRH